MNRPLILLGLFTASMTVAGCGKMGALERPGPLYGNGRTTREADEAERQTQDPNRPVNTVNPREIVNDPSPPRTAPIPGTNDPARQPPQGAIPNPYANPR